MNVTTALSAAMAFYPDALALGKSVTAALHDPAVKAETDTHAGVKAAVDRISQEWRTVENDVASVKKANFLTFFGRVSSLLSAAKVLEKDVAGEQHDPALAAALVTMPKMLAALSGISEHWTKVERDLQGFH